MPYAKSTLRLPGLKGLGLLRVDPEWCFGYELSRTAGAVEWVNPSPCLWAPRPDLEPIDRT